MPLVLPPVIVDIREAMQTLRDSKDYNLKSFADRAKIRSNKIMQILVKHQLLTMEEIICYMQTGDLPLLSIAYGRK